MDPRVKYLARITDAEFRGKSINGKSLVETIENLSMEQVKSTKTHQNYTVWTVVIHNMLYKWKLLGFMEPDNGFEYPYEHESFPKLPGNGELEDWEKTKELNILLHDRYMEALDRFDGDRLDEWIPEWEEYFGDAIAWIATHDTSHVAQIRNMGVPGL